MEQTVTCPDNTSGSVPFPPWGDAESWIQVNASLADLLANRINREEREMLHQISCGIQENLQKIAEVIGPACQVCCTSCRTICCTHAKPYFDFRDLLYLHLAGFTTPKTQPISEYAGTCAYLSATGCTLNRTIRPWICTWYICSEMRSFFENTDALQQLMVRLDAVKKDRKKLEDMLLERVKS